MSRFRASIALASLVASLVMTAGVTIGTTGTALAAPQPHYPPTAPALTVDSGSVRAGELVRARGNDFRAGETVRITIRYRPPNSNRYYTVQSYGTRTNRNGDFSLSVRMYAQGTAIISARGTRSGKSASATVRITRSGHGHGGWTLAPAAYTAPTVVQPAAVKPIAAQKKSSSMPAMAAAGLGVLALAGSALITGKTIRRRRKVV